MVCIYMIKFAMSHSYHRKVASCVCLEYEDHIFKQYLRYLDLIEHGKVEVSHAIV